MIADSMQTLLIPIPQVVIPDPGAVIPDPIYLVTTLTYGVQKIDYEIKWRKVRQARSYSNFNIKCNLCICEKYFIICKLTS